MKGFEKLLSPIEIAPNFVLKNRMIKAPQSSWRLERGLHRRRQRCIAMVRGTWRKGELRLSMSRPYCGTCGRHLTALTTTGSFPA